MAQYVHLQYDERLTIQKLLGEGKFLASIARSLKRDPKTIMYEITQSAAW